MSKWLCILPTLLLPIKVLSPTLSNLAIAGEFSTVRSVTVISIHSIKTSLFCILLSEYCYMAH